MKEGAHIIFKDGRIEITNADEFSINTLGEDKTIKMDKKNEVFIFGNTIYGYDFQIDGINIQSAITKKGPVGKATITDKGIVLNRGRATFNQLRLTADEKRETTLIAKPNLDLKTFDGNAVQLTTDQIHIISSSEGKVKLKILPDNKVLNTDKKDLMIVDLGEGDQLTITNRREQGNTPLINHESKKGFVSIKNNGMIYGVKNGELRTNIPSPLADTNYNNPYQSVPAEFVSDVQGVQKVRTSAFRQWALLDTENNIVVTKNKFDLPVSNHIEDNNIQTMEQLQKKYPSIRFTVPETVPGGFLGLEQVDNKLHVQEVPPYIIYLTDSFLTENPKATNDFDTIEFTDVYNAHVSGSTMMIGEKVVDPYNRIQVRKNSPLQVLKHEYTHREDGIIAEEEITAIKNLGDPVIDRLSSLQDKTNEELVSITKALDGEEDEKTREELSDRKIKVKNKLRKLDEDLQDYIFETYPEKRRLQTIYNEMALDAISSVFKKGKADSERLTKLISTDMYKTLSTMTQSAFGLSAEEYLLQHTEFHQETIEELKTEDPQILATSIIFDISDNKRLKDTEFEEEYKNLYQVMIDITGLKKRTNQNEWIDSMSRLEDAMNNINGLKVHTTDIRNMMARYGGLPYMYSVRNYNTYSNSIPYAHFSESSSTYAELDEATIKHFLSMGGKISKNFRKLTQLAFDTGKIGPEKYQERLGLCNEPDCSDKLCLGYNFICCEEHPNSPNC